ncbi:MAG TPA: hypothetical protein VFG10_09775 [Saprospiraceae bacterium]|nr:hypothetical protein [Saprospiraceae bacterium]
MKKILYYYLHFNIGGGGRVVYRLQNDPQDIITPNLNAVEFTALALVLAQKRLTYDTTRHTFISYDDDNPMIPDSDARA